MNYPIVYDKNETDFTGRGLTVLEHAHDVKIAEVVNGEHTLSFTLPANDPKRQYIQDDNIIKVEGQLYRIRKPTDTRDSKGAVLCRVECEHISYDLNSCKFMPYFEAIGETPEQIITAALQGTRFTLGVCEISTPTDVLGMSKTNPMAIIHKVIELVDGELERDNFTLNLRQRIGADNGVQLRFGKNIKGIKREIDSTNVITELWAFGKDDMPLPAPGYIRSPLYDPNNPKTGHKDYKNIEDPGELLAAALAEWSTADRDGIDKPIVTYSIEAVDLSKLQEYGPSEKFGLGDTITIIDEGLGINTRQRIYSIERYPYEAKQPKVELCNAPVNVYKERRPANVIGGFIRDGQYLDQVTDSQQKLNPGWFQNIKSKLKTFFNGVLHDAVMHSQGDIWVDDPENPTKAMGIIADGFAIANSKDADGNWEWKTFGNADGFFADLIVAGILRAIDIEGVTITGSVINGATINGGTINGGTIEGGTINGGTINVDTDVQIGNNLYLGEFADEESYKSIYFNDEARISGDINGLSVIALMFYMHALDLGGKWSFRYANVSGLETSGYAKQLDISEAIASHVAAYHSS